MNSSKEHINWITIGEVINVIKKPVALYTTHIVERWHITLCKDCLVFGRCRYPGTCQIKMKPGDLCSSCKGWYNKLAKSHQNKDKRKIEWRKNCDTSNLPDDSWEVAKFFMPVLGDNKATVIDAASTDLSYLLNVLTWMKDVAFAPDSRVDLNLVKDLRSVRNLWAHEPNQELTDDDFNNAFDIANKFVADLNNVFSCDKVKECRENIKFAQTGKISNVVEAELRALNSLRDALGADFSRLKEEVNQLKEEKSFDSQVITQHKRMLEKLVNAQQESSTRMDRFDKLFRQEISEIRADIKSLQGTSDLSKQKSCLPDRPKKIFGREDEVKKVVSSLVDEGCGIVSIVGGPGFGKSTLAVEVSYRLTGDDSHCIEVIFSFLSNVFTVPEVIQRLCRDVSVNLGDDPESSLIFWLKNIDKKVVLVMDNIEQLLESNVISQFTELVKTLRKNSRQQLRILTTTRTEFSIPDITTENVHIRELEENASVELLRNCCGNKEVKDETMSDLAKLCGFVPLALCITGSRIKHSDDPTKFFKWLREKPMKALRSTDRSQCVQKAIQFSFQMLSDEDQKAFVRLSVFNGDFQSESAEEVIERDDLETQDLLNELVARSLLQCIVARRLCSSDNRYMIHSLIRCYLADHDQLKNEKAVAQGLMVKHFLKMCHLWTIDSYTKDGFIGAREKLRKDSHNVEETFKICSQNQAKDLNPIIIESLESSDIYKSSSRFFYNFGWDIVPLTVLRSFFESCLKQAKGGDQPAIQITFEYLVADQEGRRTAWKSPEYTDRMEAMKETFDKNDAVLKEDWSLYQYCYYFYARYFSKATNTPYPDLLEDNLCPLPDNQYQSPMENAEQAFILIQRAHLSKKRASKVFNSDKKKYEDYMNCAKSFYNQALSTAKKLLGDHESTCTCHKVLGDLYLLWRKKEEALGCYSDAIKLSRTLQLDSNEAFVYLLKNYGLCLCFLRCFEASVKYLKEARDIADKLAEHNAPCKALVYYHLAKTYSIWKPHCEESVEYAKVAKEMHVHLDPRSLKSLENIIKTAEAYPKEKNRMRSLLNIMSVANDRQLQQNSSLPEKPLTFVGRLFEVKKIIDLVEKGCGIVSIVGEPGFGKSALAIDVSYHISNKHDIVVIFSCLSNVSTVPEVLLRLCLDIGVNPGEDPESALMFWSKCIEKKVVIVMDNIEQMLQEEVRSEFTELVVTLRKNSQQQLQILTTTQTEISILDETTENILLGELDEKSSVALLRNYCPNTKVKNSYLCYLANLCGFIPLALCIAGSRIADLDDPYELIHWLEEKPVKTLLNCDRSQCVQKAIDFSFQQLNEDDRKALTRLSLFSGNFQNKSAEEVIEGGVVETQHFLQRLVARNLIQRRSDKRFVIHSLIRCFLDRSGNHYQLKDEKVIAQRLIVKHFLKMCNSLTMHSFSKNGFIDARELLKRDSHNVEETLKICCQINAKNLNPNILKVLVNSDIYKSSSRFFYSFCQDLLSLTILRNFQEYCINVAKNRKQLPIEITFRCLVADQEGRKSAGKSNEYIDMVEAIKDDLDERKAMLKEDRNLYSYCYYFYAQFLFNQAKITLCPDLEEDLASLPENNDRSPVENAEDIIILIQRAQLSKGRAMKVLRSDKEKYEEYMNCAKSFAIRALSTSQELLGDHVLTCTSHKVLGDLYSFWRKNIEALPYYFDAIKLKKKLQLDSNETLVYLLISYGTCLSFLRYFNESKEILNEARKMADKLVQKHSPCKASVYCALAKMYHTWEPYCKEAATYANEAIEMGESLESGSLRAMENIIKTADESIE